MQRVIIDGYQVSVREGASGDEGTPRPAILLKGREGAVSTNVWIYFESPNGDMTRGRYMGLQFGVQRGSRKLSLRMNPNAFESMYDIVRNEAPVFFLYNTKDAPNRPSGTTKLITVAQFGTLDEPVGEGPEDEDG